MSVDRYVIFVLLVNYEKLEWLQAAKMYGMVFSSNIPKRSALRGRETQAQAVTQPTQVNGNLGIAWEEGNIVNVIMLYYVTMKC